MDRRIWLGRVPLMKRLDAREVILGRLISAVGSGGVAVRCEWSDDADDGRSLPS